MDLLSLILYGTVNLFIICCYLVGRGRFYQFPFWVAALSLGWFFPQAIGGYLAVGNFPPGSYSAAMFFASTCSLAAWAGFEVSYRQVPIKPCWLDASFRTDRLFWSGAFLCTIGFFFMYKLRTLPESVTNSTQWSGAAVKYLFLANIFLFGFLALWLIYLSQRKKMVSKLLVFIIPSFLLVIDAAFLMGRRSAMMNLVSYFWVGIWFVRGYAIPRWLVVAGLSAGLVLINAVGAYRGIMHDEEETLKARIDAAANVDYISSYQELLDDAGGEFSNYLFCRHVAAEEGRHDYGFIHWNMFVHNYVPGQIVGDKIKKSLKLPVGVDSMRLAKERYGHKFRTGTTLTGYRDAFESFGWLGWIKFFAIGWMMGILYRHALKGNFLGQLLYIYLLGTAMHAVSHSTHRVLVAAWVYFLGLGYPVLFWARIPASQMEVSTGES